ncbi:ComF family protein [Weissella muntiaci]|uniref:ComF family protein n=1 Tax=Weissella muntiaci TaxID=2508881 RepID=UPI00165217F2|nr:ComF family protein [Weissella muntiaci]
MSEVGRFYLSVRKSNGLIDMVKQNCELCASELIWDWQLLDFFNFKVRLRELICSTCRMAFEKLTGPFCQYCSRAIMADEVICFDCFTWQKQIGGLFKNQALYTYNSMMRNFLALYKFRSGYHLRALFKQELEETIIRLQTDLIVPIPISSQTKRERGFNQVTALIDGLEVSELLRCKPAKERQVQKSRTERLKSSQPFFIVKDVKKTVSDKTICLVDDVYTTGTTLRHAAGVLMAAGAKSVCTVTLAR